MLTVVIPLKGRIEFTLRFLWHANLARMPFKFILADGLVGDLKDYLGLFPNLDIEYIPYPDDSNWLLYFKKTHDAISRVKTPYVMIAENDDFLGLNGIQQAMNFLEYHPDYVCCSGGIAGFSVKGRLMGTIDQLTSSYTGDSKGECDSDDMKTRVLSGFKCQWLFYAVYRKPVLEGIWREIVEMNPSNFYVTEHFGTLRALSQGKAHQVEATSYFKQFDTSLAGHWPTIETNPDASFVYHLLRSRFSSDFNAMVQRISNGDEAFAEQIRKAAEPWLERLFINNYGLRARFPWLRHLKRRRRARLDSPDLGLIERVLADKELNKLVERFH